MTTNRPEFKEHDDFFFEHKKIGKVTREEFIKYIRSSHEHMRKLSQIIQQYNQTFDDYLNEWDGKFESFDDDVKDLLERWMNDGTMNHIINENLMSSKADKTYVDELHDTTTAQLAQTENKLHITAHGQLSIDRPFEQYEEGVTIGSIWGQGETSPDASSGILTTYKISSRENLPAYNYQTFMNYSTLKTFYRFLRTGNVWGEWEEENKVITKPRTDYESPVTIPIGSKQYIKITASNSNGAYIASGIYQVSNVDDGGVYSFIHKVYHDTTSADRIDFEVGYGATGHIVLTVNGSQPSKSYEYEISDTLLF